MLRTTSVLLPIVVGCWFLHTHTPPPITCKQTHMEIYEYVWMHTLIHTLKNTYEVKRTAGVRIEHLNRYDLWSLCVVVLVSSNRRPKQQGPFHHMQSTTTCKTSYTQTWTHTTNTHTQMTLSWSIMYGWRSDCQLPPTPSITHSYEFVYMYVETHVTTQMG